ncbi:MAG: M15 family metallopeptidase [Clostridiales bacterium]|jgi:D-alanyl-D-alanine carboxypeptidase|nr:M15 family metallopeptidase [Clostridiales bacterium]
MKKEIALILAAACLAGGLSSCRGEGDKEPSNTNDTEQTAAQTTGTSESAAGSQTSVTVDTQSPAAPSVVTDAQGLTYINGILVVNKTYALPSTYDPGVDSEAYAALQEMFRGAAAENISLEIISGYRSYSRQNTLYNNYVARDGVEAADTYSARAGHSEHQTGLAFDLNSLEESFGQTKEGIWLKEHCWEYGFIIRYPKGKESVTGYMYEPWHVRYIGEEAKEIEGSGMCLEEYLGVRSAYAE